MDNIICGINSLANLMHTRPERILEIYLLENTENKRILKTINYEDEKYKEKNYSL